MALRVLHVGKFYPPARGGMEKVLQVLAEAERGAVDNHVLVANESRETVHETVNGVPVTRVGALTRVGAVAVCPTFPYWMRRQPADVMVIHEPNPVALVAHALMRPRAPVIFWVHAEVVRPAWKYKLFYRPFLRRILRLSARIVVASPQVAEHAAELQPFRDKCVVIPYALDPDQHARTPAISARVDAIRAEGSEPLVLFVGRLVPYKGVDVLIRALAQVNARAVIVGDGPLRVELEALAHTCGVANRVRFAGNASSEELAALYNACDLFVLPSVTRAEAFGMVQIEAMSCRKPVICTDLPSGVPWVNQHGETGLVVPPGQVDPLATAIRTLLDNPGLRARMGEAGRARVESQFSIARLVEQTTSLYRAAAGTPIPAADGARAGQAGA
ncbi:MAG: glycosyltransferase [Vicinamibacterales bacterium]